MPTDEQNLNDDSATNPSGPQKAAPTRWQRSSAPAEGLG